MFASGTSPKSNNESTTALIITTGKNTCALRPIALKLFCANAKHTPTSGIIITCHEILSYTLTEKKTLISLKINNPFTIRKKVKYTTIILLITLPTPACKIS